MTRSLLLRILSAAVLIPLALAAAWAGGPWFAAVVGIFALGMAWEWGRICDPPHRTPLQAAAIVVAIAGAAAAAAAGWPVAGIAVAAAGAAAAGMLAGRGGTAPAWMAPAGTFYIALAVLAVLHIRGAADARPTLWLFAVVWATDIAAYGAGRSIGGPKLAPRFSPHKTWSGLLGGATVAALVGWAVAAATGGPAVAVALAAAFLLAFVAQAGDLAESAAKRYAGIKDASGLIPGHGGVLDRLDGLMAAALAFAALRHLTGEGLLEWR
ncbi:phosphatidate cytidylyltransferase [Stella sp.]|uniref:phosphatidate cytidylyltransferase n=1 Tax=Stella sp. TaxID=2912054 RepID=UPI0035B1DDFA